VLLKRAVALGRELFLRAYRRHQNLQAEMKA
jgi:hypothetical protein